MKISVRDWIILLVLAVCTSVLRAQAVVEAGLGAGRAAVSTAPAKDLGKSIAGVVGNLDKALKADKSETSTTLSLAPAAGTKTVTPKRTYEDLRKVEVGLSYAELVDRFGPPALEVEGASGRKTLTYGKTGSTQIEVKDDKVSTVTTAKQQPGVFVLPR